MASGCLFSPIGAYINERFSYRFTAIVGSCLGIIGFFLASWSSKLWMMDLTYGVLSGLGHAMVYNSSYLTVLEYFVKWRSVAVGIVASAPAIGMFVMTQFTQSLLTTFGWQGALKGFALLHFVCILCSTVFVPLDNLEEESNGNTIGKIKQQETASENLSLCRNFAFLIMLSSFVVVKFGYFVPTVHIVSTCRSLNYFNLQSKLCLVNDHLGNLKKLEKMVVPRASCLRENELPLATTQWNNTGRSPSRAFGI